MVDVLAAIGIAASYYNLALVIVATWLFITLFRTKSKVSLKPWVLIFMAVLVYVVEEAITVLRALDFIQIPIHINGFFELVIISLIIYALLVQGEAVSGLKGRKK